MTSRSFSFRSVGRFASFAPLAPFAMALVIACDKPADDMSVPDAAPSSTTAPVTTAPSAAPSAAAAPKVKKRTSADCDKGTAVTFWDPNLEKEVRRKVQKDAGALTKADLGQVRSLDLSRWGRTDSLDPCLMPLFTSLHALFFGPGDVDDLGPLTTLSSLESLRASPSKVTDATPIQRLLHMDVLILSDSGITDLKAIGSLVNLTELSVDDTQVSDLSPIEPLKKLELLSIKNTNVTDLTPIKDMKKLKKLYLKGSKVTDTSAISSLISGGLKVFRE